MVRIRNKQEYIIQLHIVDKKKALQVFNLQGLIYFSALQVGLEPTTYGLTVRRSNQLSY